MKLKKIRNEFLFVTSAFVVAIAITSNEADADKMIDKEDVVTCIPINAGGSMLNAERSMLNAERSMLNAERSTLNGNQILSLRFWRGAGGEDSRPTNNDHDRKNDGNGCPHQQPGWGMLCNSTAYKKRFNKIPAC